MKNLLPILLILLAGCMSGGNLKRSSNNQILPALEKIELSDVDINEDGNITHQEVEIYKMTIDESSTKVSQPLWAIVIIIISTLTMCLVCAFMRCNKNE